MTNEPVTNAATSPPALPDAAIEALAARLDHARRTGIATAQLTIDTDLSVDDAYRVQRAGIALRTARGERVVGAKLGLTSKAKAEQMGVSDVIIGVLTDAMHVADGGSLDIGRGVHPRIEPEVVFRLSETIDPASPPADLRGAIDAIAPAMEVIDSRYENFRFTLPDVVADNTSGSGFVIGPWTARETLDDSELAGRAVTLKFDGETVESGLTTDILGDPWEALPAAVRMAGRYGITLEAGTVLLAGAATAAHALSPVTDVTATVAGLGNVSVTIGGAA